MKMQILRPAGFNERRCIARDSLSLYGTIVTVGIYNDTSEDSKDLTKDDIYKALKDCIARQPVLSTIVLDSDTEQPQLARAPSINLDNHVKFFDDTDRDLETFLEPFLEDVHADPLSDYETRPQWRLYVASPMVTDRDLTVTYRIAFASSHALCDGASGLVFHKAFLEALRGLDDLPFSPDPVYEPVLKEPKLLPPLEQLADFKISWSFLLGPLVSEYAPGWLASWLGFSPEVKDSMAVDRAWTGAAARPEKPVGQLPPTAVEFVAIAPDVLTPVLEECRKHGARLTGLLNHLAARGLARALRGQDEQYGKFLVDTAIDLRRCLPQAQGKMGNFVSASVETIPAKTNDAKGLTQDDWAAVRKTTEDLSRASQTLSDQPIALLKYLTKFRHWTLKNASAPAKGALGMSNIGNFDPGRDPESSWTIDEMLFSQSADCTNAPLNVNVASAKGGNLWLVVSWWPGMLGVQDERRLAKDLCEDVLAQLKAIADVPAEKSRRQCRRHSNPRIE